MREELEQRIEKISLMVGSAIFISYLTHYSIQQYYLIYLNMIASGLCILVHHLFVRNWSYKFQLFFFLGQWLIHMGLIFNAPDSSMAVLLLLVIMRFSDGVNSKATFGILISYVLGYTTVALWHDQVYSTNFDQFIPVVILGMFISAYIRGSLGDYHLRLKELALIQENLLKRTKGAIQFIDREGKTRILNKEAEVMYKLNAAKAYGKTDYELLFNGRKFNDDGSYTSLITETLETGKEYDGIECSTQMPSGESRYHHIQTFRIYDDFNNVLGALGIYRDITLNKKLQEELQATNAALTQMTVTDAVTEIFNFRYFQRRLKEEIEEKKQDIALLMIDVDYFKRYNDLNGHQAGNRVLKEIAQEIKENVRSVDVVVRYGGEEFAVILPGVDLEEAMEIAMRLRAAIEYHRFEGEEKMPGGQLTISVGVVACKTGEMTAEKLIYEADQAMYKSKAKGRNRVEAAS